LADSGHALFDTAIGRCALAWGPLGLTAVQLPEDSDATTVRRLLTNAGPSEATTVLPRLAVQAVADVQALLSGERRDLQGLPLDMSRMTGFQCAVYAIARAIPPGQTRSYGEIASELGDVKLARAVGQALGRNPFAPVVPCHRVLAAGNQPGGSSANGGAVTKMRMLAIEGVVPGATLPMFGEV
jgi:methylated-DNA-[protein]-cysteine S-methyltransferase